MLRRAMNHDTRIVAPCLESLVEHLLLSCVDQRHTDGSLELEHETASNRRHDAWCTAFFSLSNIGNISVVLFSHLHEPVSESVSQWVSESVGQ